VQVKPAGIVADEAFFGSDADFCQHTGCERLIVESAQV